MPAQEMGDCPAAAAPGAGLGNHHHRGAERLELSGCDHLLAGVASPEAALWPRRFGDVGLFVAHRSLSWRPGQGLSAVPADQAPTAPPVTVKAAEA